MAREGLGGNRSIGPFPWRGAALLSAVTLFAFLLLPYLAPRSVAGLSDELLLGVISGMVIGLGLRADPRITPLLGAAAALGVAAHFLLAVGAPEHVILIALLIGIEIWLCVVLVRRLGADRLERPIDVLEFVVVALVVGAVTGLAAAAALELDGGNHGGYLENSRSWLIDAVFGIVCIAPAFITIRRPASWSWRSAAELSITYVISLSIAFAIFRVVTPENPGLFGWPYVVLLGPMWVAARLGVAAVAPLIALISWFAAASTADALGTFAHAATSPRDDLVAVQLFCGAIAVTLLLLAILRDSRLRSMQRLSESSRLLREVVDGSAALVFAKSYEAEGTADGRYILVNEAWEGQTGIAATDTLGRSDRDLFGPDFATTFSQGDREVIEAQKVVTVEERAPRADGEVRIYSSSKFPLRREDGSIWGVGGIATDTTDLVQALDRQRRQAGLLRAVFELSPTPAVRIAVSADGTLETLAANSAMCALVEVEPDCLTDGTLLDRVHPDDVAAARDVLDSTARGRGLRVRAGGIRQREVRLLAGGGETVWTLMSAAAVGSSSGVAPVEIVVQFENFTARRRAEEALTNQALRDTVTGLPNRRALQDRLESALQRLHRQKGVVAVLFCDLDRFKDVNDTQGHQAGDLLLVEVARRMQAALRPEDTVARLGGDEFVALSEGIADVAAAVQMAMRLLEKINMPWIQGDQTYRPSVSIGLAIVDDPALTPDEVLRRADLAMYRAKDNGRGRLEIYEKSVDERYRFAVARQHDLRRCIDEGTLILHYQPIVELSDERVIGAEALVRMPSRDGGLLAPGLFVPAAETSGLIIPMGAWVVRQAVAQLKAWSVAERGLTVSVNVSPSQLRDEGFAEFVLGQLDAAGVDPSRLAVEVTETVLLNEPGRSARELNALSREGVAIYLDDFGTGYSSLSWLTQFPVNVVKIDRSFTDEVGIDERKTAIVSALIQVSHKLGFSVVAEGVETATQADLLIGLGCDRGQGYHFGRPVDIGSPPWT